MMTIHFQNDDVINCDVIFGKKKKYLLFTISAYKFNLVHFANVFIALKTFCFQFIVQPVSFTYIVRRTHDSFDTLEASAAMGKGSHQQPTKPMDTSYLRCVNSLPQRFPAYRQICHSSICHGGWFCHQRCKNGK